MSEITQEELLQKAGENLPDEYMEALSELGIPERVDKIATQHQLPDAEIQILDQEVVYLMLNLTGPADFTERLAAGLDVDDDQLMKIINSVTEGIINPLEKHLNGNDGNRTASMPVPPPPPAPTAGYGGTSDPYREPTDR